MQLKLEAGKRLSIGEIEVTKLIVRGFSNAEIAQAVSERLGCKMSIKAAEDTCRRIYKVTRSHSSLIQYVTI